jgi:hypothetical protein
MLSTHFSETTNVAGSVQPSVPPGNCSNPSTYGSGPIILNERRLFTNPVTRHTNQFTVSTIIRNVGILGTWYFNLPSSIPHGFIAAPHRTPYTLPSIPTLMLTPQGIFNLLCHWDVPADPSFYGLGYNPIQNAMIGFLSTGYSSGAHFHVPHTSIHPVRKALYAEMANAFE